MLGAIAGDIIGSVYEGHDIKRVDFPLFDPRCRLTDDTVLTVAVADAIMTSAPYGEKLKEYYRYYPHAGYGAHFRRWAAHDDTRPYYSMGNGSAMRVSPVGFAFDTLEEVLRKRRKAPNRHTTTLKGSKGLRRLPLPSISQGLGGVRKRSGPISKGPSITTWPNPWTV